MPLLSVDSSVVECQGGTDFIVRLPDNYANVRHITLVDVSIPGRTTPYYIVQVECPDAIDHMTHLLEKGGFAPALAKVRYTRETQDYYAVQMDPYVFPSGPINLRQIRIRLLLPNGTPVKGLAWVMTFRIG